MTPGVRNLRAALRLFTASGRPRRLALHLPSREVTEANRDWRYWAREGQQLPPDGEAWRCWLILGGRGAGKTRAGAEWVRAIALGLWEPALARCERIAIVGPTFDEARAVMIEGKSGLLAIHQPEERPKFEPSKRRLTWPNGTVAQVFSAAEPEGLRGPQFDAAWCDELAKWPRAEEAWMNLQMALRLGTRPVAVVTTTPRPMALLKKLMSDPATALSRSRTKDNAAHLAESFMADVTARYGGTRLGRQELDGELIEDDPDALFARGVIEAARVQAAPELARVVVAVDPPAGDGTGSNACGIICAGLGVDGRCYVLDDATLRGASPAKWAARVVALYHARRASRVVAEVNQGGAMVEAVIRECDGDVAFTRVHATRGKVARAEPVAALYEQGRVSHVGLFADLEDQMCQRLEKGAKSPDRVDALVWAVTELMLKRKAEPKVRVV
jgi:phage terminase large subunit-like protein